MIRPKIVYVGAHLGTYLAKESGVFRQSTEGLPLLCNHGPMKLNAGITRTPRAREGMA